MSNILIYAQSLQNDGNDYLLYDGKYHQGFSQELSWSVITELLNELRKSFPTMCLDKKTSISYRNTKKGLYCIIPSEQADNENRTALISIFCPREEKNNLEQELDAFLKKSGFSICQENRAFVKKEISKSICNVDWTDKGTLKGLFVGFVAILGFRYMFKKSRENKNEHNE